MCCKPPYIFLCNLFYSTSANQQLDVLCYGRLDRFLECRLATRCFTRACPHYSLREKWGGCIFSARRVSSVTGTYCHRPSQQLLVELISDDVGESLTVPLTMPTLHLQNQVSLMTWPVEEPDADADDSGGYHLCSIYVLAVLPTS